MIKATIKTTRKKGKGLTLEEIARRAERAQAERLAVKVGLPVGKAPGSVIEYATYNHFGTRHIPARPFITIAVFKKRGQLREVMRQIGAHIINDGGDPWAAMAEVGGAVQGMIQDQIRSNMPPPNKPSTIKRKKSSRTLVDTGQMMQSITWDYDD